MEPTACPEILDRNYQTMQQNMPERRRNKPEEFSLEELFNINRVHLMFFGGVFSVIKQTDTYITSKAVEGIYNIF